MMRCRSEADLVEVDLEIGSRIYLRNQEITMENDELKRKIEGLK